MKGNLTIKGDVDEPVFCFLDEAEGVLMFGGTEEDAVSGMAYSVEKMVVKDAKSFTLTLAFEGSQMALTFAAGSYTESAKWARAFIAASKRRMEINAAAAAAAPVEVPAEAPVEAPPAETPAEVPATEVASAETVAAEAAAAAVVEEVAVQETPEPPQQPETPQKTPPRQSTLRQRSPTDKGATEEENLVAKYGKFGVGGLVLFLLIFGNPLGGSSRNQGPAYADPALFGRPGPPIQMQMPQAPPPPPQAFHNYPAPESGGPVFGFFTSFTIFLSGIGLIYFGLQKKKEADEPMVNEWREPEQTPEEPSVQTQVVEPDIYTVEFKTGPLGFSLVNDNVHGVVIGSVAPGGAAHSLNVQAGFKVLSVAGHEVLATHKWDHVVDMIKQNPRPIVISLLRNPDQVAAAAAEPPPKPPAPPPAVEVNINEAYEKELAERVAKRQLATKILAGGGSLSFLGFLLLYLWLFSSDPTYHQPRQISYVRETSSGDSLFGTFFYLLIILGGAGAYASKTGLLKMPSKGDSDFGTRPSRSSSIKLPKQAVVEPPPVETATPPPEAPVVETPAPVPAPAVAPTGKQAIFESLSEEEFLQKFKCTRAEFNKKAKWKKDELLKAAGLF